MCCFYMPAQWVMSCLQWAAGEQMCHLPLRLTELMAAERGDGGGESGGGGDDDGGDGFGLRVGKTKVFLRQSAFDSLEVDSGYCGGFAIARRTTNTTRQGRS